MYEKLFSSYVHCMALLICLRKVTQILMHKEPMIVLPIITLVPTTEYQISVLLLVIKGMFILHMFLKKKPIF